MNTEFYPENEKKIVLKQVNHRYYIGIGENEGYSLSRSSGSGRLGKKWVLRDKDKKILSTSKYKNPLILFFNLELLYLPAH
jgi:hypothetical protein